MDKERVERDASKPFERHCPMHLQRRLESLARKKLLKLLLLVDTSPISEVKSLE